MRREKKRFPKELTKIGLREFLPLYFSLIHAFAPCFSYPVCQKFLQTYPEEQKRLWEVEAPGDWSQRVNIWLKIQMESSPAGSELK